MVINKIKYKNITFDYFEIWLGMDVSVLDHDPFEFDVDFESEATCVSTQICPWCIKKYGLYSEVGLSPEAVDGEIKYFADLYPEYMDVTCGIEGCYNGGSDYVDICWDGFEIVE